MMTSQSYYYQQTCPVGSDLYYSLRKLTTEKREAIVFIVAFYNAIYHILFNCSDMTIAHTKLRWWKDQVEKMYCQQADHPIAQALQKFLMIYNLPKKYFLETIIGMETYLNTPLFPSQQEVYHHLCHTAGARELLINQVMGNYNEDIIRLTYQVTAGLELTQQISRLRYLTVHGHCFFDEYSLGEHQLTAQSFIVLKTTENIRLLLKQKVELARQYLKQANTLSQPFQLRAKFALALLNKIEKKQYQVLEQEVQLVPLYKFYLFVGK